MLKSFFDKAAGQGFCNFIEKRLQYSYLHVKFAKFLRTLILSNVCERLFLVLNNFDYFTSEKSFFFS